jgi:predicted flap endonuclease-1-like 5' DNA nuclease
MPQLTLLQAMLLLIPVLVAAAAGWIIRGIRAGRERREINAAWQENTRQQQQEQQRLQEQNAYLMERNSRFNTESKAAKKRARELAESVQEANLRRRDLRRKLKAIRADLENAVTQRDELKMTMSARGDDPRSSQDKDGKIFQLSRELESWQKRLPPLIERYRKRDQEAQQLELELAEARVLIEELEQIIDGSVSVVEPVQHPAILTDGRDASNDTIDTERPDDLQDTDIRAGNSGPVGNTLRDNLQLIRGIGPAIERTLNEMGIFRYQQIAGMSQYDIDRLAQRLKGFHTRIYREDWIGQARELDTRNISA